jgi:hypothetical protein
MSYRALVKTMELLSNSARFERGKTIVRIQTTSNNSKIPNIFIQRIRNERCMRSCIQPCISTNYKWMLRITIATVALSINVFDDFWPCCLTIVDPDVWWCVMMCLTVVDHVFDDCWPCFWRCLIICCVDCCLCVLMIVDHVFVYVDHVFDDCWPCVFWRCLTMFFV